MTIGVERCRAHFGIRLGRRRNERRFILRSDIAPVHREPSFGIDADEDAGTDDVGRLKDHRSVFERHQCRFDLAEALIDVVGQFICVLVVKFQLGLLGVECIDGRLLFDGEIGRSALQFTQAASVTEGEFHGDRDPFPAFLGNASRPQRSASR